MNHSQGAPRRVQLTLRKPGLGWFPKPTVLVDGVGQPAQWGTRSWKVPAEGTVNVRIYLFNRLWRFGAAAVELPSGGDLAYEYRAPWLPFLPGTLRAVA